MTNKDKPQIERAAEERTPIEKLSDVLAELSQDLVQVGPLPMASKNIESIIRRHFDEAVPQQIELDKNGHPSVVIDYASYHDQRCIGYDQARRDFLGEGE